MRSTEPGADWLMGALKPFCKAAAVRIYYLTPSMSPPSPSLCCRYLGYAEQRLAVAFEAIGKVKREDRYVSTLPPLLLTVTGSLLNSQETIQSDHVPGRRGGRVQCGGIAGEAPKEGRRGVRDSAL